jgi:pyruvate-formate lyase-activating enzyme
MIKFHKNIIQTYKDIPNEVSILIHAYASCPFKCMGCFNYDSLCSSTCDKQNVLNEDEVIVKIKNMDHIVTSIILSGGEFLSLPLEQIKTFLTKLKLNFSGNIILYSNGYFPEKLNILFNEKFIDGVHMDLKLPYFSLQPDLEVTEMIIGKALNQTEINNLKKSIEIIAKNDKGKSYFRTVKYPILGNDVFDMIKNEVFNVNQKYQSKIPWSLNEFVYVN